MVVVVADRNHRVHSAVEEHQAACADGGSSHRSCLESCAVGKRYGNAGRAAQLTERGRWADGDSEA